MKFSDIVYSSLFGYFFNFVFHVNNYKCHKKIKTNWAKYRCNPMMMPFAGYAGHDPIENFTQCMP